MQTKHSQQRDALLAALKSRCDHPTADDIYFELRKTHPNISLGTVYRNLSKLCESGQIIKIVTPSGADRFDGNISCHYHLQCTECNSVTDIFMEEEGELNKKAAKVSDSRIDGHVVMFYGKCKSCNI